ncbi:DUF4870 domain-containing protein [Actinoallomurus soli]|uniref:DUF4870 domain-containing protein n=1 Tax=Actinoallomurus soli TaxID=2952535 RepID=UPI002092F079|nr:DUF4870 domain-containing protein [Actinoallomurus soli]MCO5966884.1 DUF4870 domain-containing protein [Actinoallomurus soli]
MSGPAAPAGPPQPGPAPDPQTSGPRPGPYARPTGPHPGPHPGPAGPQSGPHPGPYGAPAGPQTGPHPRPYGAPAGPPPGSFAGPPQPGPYPHAYGGRSGPPPYGPPPNPPGPPPYGPPPNPSGSAHAGPPYAGPPVPYGYGPPRQGFAATDENTWALLAYLGQFAIGLIAPLIVYLAQKDRSPYLRFHGAQALNLALTSLLLTIACVVVSLATLGIGAIVAIPAMLAYGVAHVIYLIVAALRANKGELYVIPKWLCWPIVR